MSPEEREATIREITARLAARRRQLWPDEQVSLAGFEHVVARAGGEALREPIDLLIWRYPKDSTYDKARFCSMGFGLRVVCPIDRDLVSPSFNP